MVFDPTKPVQTRDGRAARVLCTDLLHPDGYSVAAAVNYGGSECLSYFKPDGKFWNDQNPDMDLVNIPGHDGECT